MSNKQLYLILAAILYAPNAQQQTALSLSALCLCAFLLFFVKRWIKPKGSADAE